MGTPFPAIGLGVGLTRGARMRAGWLPAAMTPQRRREGKPGAANKLHALPCPLPDPPHPQALEYQMQQGVTESQKMDAFIRPYSESVHAYGPVAGNGVASIQLLL